jgi:hypothetical protein
VDNYTMPRFLLVSVALLASPWCYEVTCCGQDAGKMQEYARQVAEEKSTWKKALKLTNRKEIDLSKLAKPSQPPWTPQEMRVGDIGKLSYWNFRIISIIDKENCLVQHGKNGPFWLTGYPTEGLADDDEFRLIDPVRMEETRTYESVIGAKKTVKCMRMLSPEDAAKWEEENPSWAIKYTTDEESSFPGSLKEQSEFKLTNGQVVKGTFLELRSNGAIFDVGGGKKVRHKMAEFDEKSREKLRELIKQSSTKK